MGCEFRIAAARSTEALGTGGSSGLPWLVGGSVEELQSGLDDICGPSGQSLPYLMVRCLRRGDHGDEVAIL